MNNENKEKTNDFTELEKNWFNYGSATVKVLTEVSEDLIILEEDVI